MIAGLCTHPEPLLLPEALHGPFQPQELVRLQREVQILRERLAGIPFLFLQQPRSFLDASPAPFTMCAV